MLKRRKLNRFPNVIYDAFPARGKLPMKNVFHSKMDSLLYVEVVGVT